MLQFMLYEVFWLDLQTASLTVDYRDDRFTNLILTWFDWPSKKQYFEIYFPRFYIFQYKFDLKNTQTTKIINSTQNPYIVNIQQAKEKQKTLKTSLSIRPKLYNQLGIRVKYW